MLYASVIAESPRDSSVTTLEVVSRSPLRPPNCFGTGTAPRPLSLKALIDRWANVFSSSYFGPISRKNADKALALERTVSSSVSVMVRSNMLAPAVTVGNVAGARSADDKVVAACLAQCRLVGVEQRRGQRKQFQRHRPLAVELHFSLGHGQGEVELALPEPVAVVRGHPQLHRGLRPGGCVAEQHLLTGKVDENGRGRVGLGQQNHQTGVLGRLDERGIDHRDLEHLADVGIDLVSIFEGAHLSPLSTKPPQRTARARADDIEADTKV